MGWSRNAIGQVETYNVPQDNYYLPRGVFYPRWHNPRANALGLRHLGQKCCTCSVNNKIVSWRRNILLHLCEWVFNPIDFWVIFYCGVSFPRREWDFTWSSQSEFFVLWWVSFHLDLEWACACEWVFSPRFRLQRLIGQLRSKHTTNEGWRRVSC